MIAAFCTTANHGSRFIASSCLPSKGCPRAKSVEEGYNTGAGWEKPSTKRCAMYTGQKLYGQRSMVSVSLLQQ